MGIKFDSETNSWTAFYCRRHPITKAPRNLKRIKLSSKAEALRVERELVILLEQKFRQAVIPDWKTILPVFYDDMRERNLTARTRQTYSLCLEAHTLEAWGDKLIDSINAHEIRTLIQTRVGHKSVAHQQNLTKFVRAVFNCAVDRGIIKSNPTPQLRFKSSDKAKLVLSEDQVSTLLCEARQSSEWYPHWALALLTGMRNGELYALTWDRIDFDNGNIIVSKSWNCKDEFKSTKSGHERIVPINKNLMTVLKELKSENAHNEFVLPRNSHWNKGDQARELRKFLLLIGLPQVRFHDLRATWATLLLSKGVPPAQVMKMGGWRDMKTMMIYMRMAGIDVRGATDCLAFDTIRRRAKLVQIN